MPVHDMLAGQVVDNGNGIVCEQPNGAEDVELVSWENTAIVFLIFSYMGLAVCTTTMADNLLRVESILINILIFNFLDSGNFRIRHLDQM